MHNSVNNEKELLFEVIKGNEAAFRELYHIYQGKIFAYAWKLTKSKDTATEVVQSVFIKLWKKRADIETYNNFEGYVIKTTQNHILNLLRDAARERERRTEIYENMASLRNNPEEDLYAKELTKVYLQAIELLAPQKKRIYQLREQSFLTHAQIGELLRISPLTVKKHMTEAVRLIREYVKKHSHLEFSLLISFISMLKNS